MQVSIVIPNYNGLENLKNNLPKVTTAINHFSGSAELILIDDASSDASIEFSVDFCQKTKNCQLISNPENLGFAESCNIGVKRAEGEIVVLLNSDVYPDENFLAPIVKHFENEQVFAVGCLEKVLDDKNEVIEERGVGELFFKDGIFQHHAGDLDSSMTDWVCGGSGAYRRDIFLELGGFDPQFKPFYWEDIDLSYQAKQKGYQLIFEKNSVVFHKHLKGAIMTHFSHAEINKISFANQIKFTKKHVSGIIPRLQLYIFLLKTSLKTMIEPINRIKDQIE